MAKNFIYVYHFEKFDFKLWHWKIFQVSYLDLFLFWVFFLILIFVNKGIKINFYLKSWTVKNEKMIKWLYQK